MAALDQVAMTVPIDIILRLATEADLPRLEWFGQYSHFRQLFRRSFREQQLGRRLMLLADSNDFPIGHVFIQLKSNNPKIADGRRRAYLYSFRVMEMFRGKGIGTRLLHEAEAMVHERGLSATTLAVAKNNPQALRLYKRQGYRVFGDDPGRWSYLDHNGRRRYVKEACWLLEKRLENG